MLEIPEGDAARVVGQLATEEVGEVYDAQFVGDHVFLLGERGLQLFDLASHRIVDSIDVERMSRLTPMGRHLVAVGDGRLQVVDMSAWTPRGDEAMPPGAQRILARKAGRVTELDTDHSPFFSANGELCDLLAAVGS